MTELIKVDNLSFTYPAATKPAVEQISFYIDNGESVGLIGPNGAGKSTLLLQLVGILQGEGTISINNLKVGPKNLAAIRKHVGLVFSNPDDQLFCATVHDDIAFGPRNLGIDESQIPQIVTTALNQVGLPGFEERPPHLLSSGEKRRIAIATIIAMNPSLLILDEPNNDLDPRARRELIGLLNAFTPAKLIASHDLDFIDKTCTRCLVIQNGTITHDASCTDVLNDRSLLDAHGLR